MQGKQVFDTYNLLILLQTTRYLHLYWHICYHSQRVVMSKQRIVIDTNILVSTILSPQSQNRKLLRLCFEGIYQPVIGHKLFLEYEDVLNRREIVSKSPFSKEQCERLLNNFAHTSIFTSVYYTWRPNLRDEGDNHLIELAIAGNAPYIVTYNIKDFKNPELVFPNIKVLTPKELLKTRKD